MSVTHHNHQKLHDPRYIGPGIWFNMHLDAAEAKTRAEQVLAVQRFRRLQQRFPCLKCKEHFKEYLDRHPPEQIVGTSQEALFRWSVEFHNAVNAFTGKAQVSYTDAHNIFYIPDFIVCSADCTDSDDEFADGNTVSVGEYKTGSTTSYSVSKPNMSGMTGSKSQQTTSISALAPVSGPLGYTILPATRRR
jgi:hypothetical protein